MGAGRATCRRRRRRCSSGCVTRACSRPVWHPTQQLHHSSATHKPTDRLAPRGVSHTEFFSTSAVALKREHKQRLASERRQLGWCASKQRRRRQRQTTRCERLRASLAPREFARLVAAAAAVAVAVAADRVVRVALGRRKRATQRRAARKLDSCSFVRSLARPLIGAAAIELRRRPPTSRRRRRRRCRGGSRRRLCACVWRLARRLCAPGRARARPTRRGNVADTIVAGV